jgi:peptidoglycan/LPS O-acetylase OafA/YrhL
MNAGDGSAATDAGTEVQAPVDARAASTNHRPLWFTLADGLKQPQDNFLLLRFLAAALVIYGHGYAMTVHAPGVTDIFMRLGWGNYSGTIGVDIFFVISGFLVTGSFLRRHSVPRFVWARALRLLPAFVACLLVSAFVLGAIYTQLPMADYLQHPGTRGYVLANLHVDKGMRWDLPGVFIDNPRRSTINGSIWTLPIEVRMYAWVAIFGGLTLLARRARASVAILALLLAGWFVPGHVPLLTIPGSARLGAMFALGTLCYLHRDRIPLHGALLVVIAALCWIVRDTWAYPIAFALAETAFVFWFAYGLRWHAFNRFGDYSYGLYLWGFPMQQVVAHHLPQAAPWQNSALSLPLATALGALSWYAVEKPALKMKRWSPRMPLLANAKGWMSSLRARAIPWLARHARWPTVIALAIAAFAYLQTSLVAIANFGLRYPAFDQYRTYRQYLGLPFPDNAMQIENGHRPILPVLVRLAEIRWLDADQMLQLVTGVGAALAATGLIIATIVRAKDISIVARAGACALALLAVFWLGNARMLMHGNELVHVYFVMLFCVLAILAVNAARERSPTLYMSLAGVCCIAATFSFGAGVASFGCVLALGVLARVRMRDIAIPAGLLVFVLALYVLDLPADDGVRGVLRFDPAGSLAVIARCLSAPWMRAWFGLGDPPLESWMQSSLLEMRAGAPLVVSARWLAAGFGDHALMRESATLGGIGMIAFALAAIHAWRRRGHLDAVRVLGLGLSTFAIGVAVLLCFARLRLFMESPEQVFADRYLPWSCLFWLGLALYAVAGVRERSGWRIAAFTGAVVAAMLVLFPSHRSMAGWSSTVSRHIAQSAVAAQLGIWDPDRFADGADATRDDVLATLDLLEARHLSMYAEPAFGLIEQGWHAPADIPPALETADARVVREFDDTLGHRRVADFEGWMPRVEHRPRAPVLAVVDASGHLRGLAKTGYIGLNKHSLRFNVAQKRGFDGYVLDPQPGEALQVLVLDSTNTRVLAMIPLTIPAASTADD